jgi:hypothetical protein
MSKTVQKTKSHKELTEKQVGQLSIKILKSLPFGKVYAIDSITKMQVFAVSMLSLYVLKPEWDGHRLHLYRYDYFNKIVLEKQDGTAETLWERSLKK